MSGSSTAKGLWLVPGSVLFAATIWWGGYNLASVLGHDESTETTTYSATDVGVIDVDNSAGPITVRGTDDATAADTITLVAEVSDGWRRTENRHELVDGALVVRGSCPAFGSTWCSVRYTLEVPHDMAALQLDADNDRIRVFDISGSVDAHSDNGSIALQGVSGEIDATSDNGRVSGESITSTTARFSTDNGSVRVQFGDAPSDVTARTSNGSVTIELPRPGPYAVDASTDNGSVNVDVAEDDSSDRRITATSDNGSVTVRYGD